MPVPRHWFPGINCGQPLTKCTDANLGFCACFSQNSGLSLFVRLGRVEIATRGVGVSVIEGDRGGKGRKSFFVFSLPPPPHLPLIRPNLSAFLQLNMAVSTRGLSVQTITLAHLFYYTLSSITFSISYRVDEANREAILTSLSANLTLLSVHLTLLLEIMHCARNLQIIH